MEVRRSLVRGAGGSGTSAWVGGLEALFSWAIGRYQVCDVRSSVPSLICPRTREDCSSVLFLGHA